MPPRFTPGDKLGPYTLRSPLGEGVAAEVWLASVEGAGGVRRNVALKLIKGPPDREVYDNILREARIAGRLQHPNIVDVLGVEIQGKALFVVMHYVAGGTLRELVSRIKRAELGVPHSVTVDLMVDVLRGLARAHGDASMERPQVLHRDLKPENVLLDLSGCARVTDFGMAKLIGEATMTAVGQIKGTQRYVAPEIWAGTRDFHPRCDLFAVGCMLYELVTLKRLFPGGLIEVIELIRNRSAEQEAADVDLIAPPLAPIVYGLLRRDPDARYQAAQDVIDDLAPTRNALGYPGDVGDFLRALAAVESKKTLPRLRARLEPSDDRHWAALGERL